MSKVLYQIRDEIRRRTLAEGSESRLSFGCCTQCVSIVDVSDWTNDQNPESHQKRSDIVSAIIQNSSTKQLKTIVETGWDVNEILNITRPTGPTFKYSHRNQNQETALHEASRQGWSEGVKMLFDAGANYMTPGVLKTPLELALHEDYSATYPVIELLLKHGADLNPSGKRFDSLPLVKAINCIPDDENFTNIVQLLLENGADPNVGNHIIYIEGQPVHTAVPVRCPLSEVIDQLDRRIYTKVPSGIRQELIKTEAVDEVVRSNAVLFRTLVHFGGNVNMEVTKPLIHRMVDSFVNVPIFAQSELICQKCRTILYLREHLDIFYQNGGNINMEYGDHGTVLECAVRECGHSNIVRWLIRHGADIQPSMFTLLKGHFIPKIVRSAPQQQFEEPVFILLRAGMRVSHGIYGHLINIEKEMLSKTWQAQSTRELRLLDIWYILVKEEKEELQKVGNKLRKNILSDYLNSQMVDLEEFSNESLQVYPEFIQESWQPKNKLEYALAQIHLVLEFLSQPQSLHWYCRRCVRENLVSLQPSVVKTLPVPARMKRYILCHEI